VPSSDDVAAVLDVLDGWLAVAVRLAIVTGARRGELCALQFGDIDIERQSVEVCRSVSQSTGQPLAVGHTKTGSKGRRTVSIGDPATVAMLVEWRAERSAKCVALGAPAPVWVFGRLLDDGPLRPDTVTQAWGRACDVAGVSIRFHDLRHYSATVPLMAGEPLIVVSKRLGHSRVGTTADRYSAFIPGADASTAAMLGESIRRNPA
jgi:integrase